MRFAGLALHDAVPDAKTIWLYREQLTRAGALASLFARFDAVLTERGFLAMGGQIVDATVVEARRPRLTKEEKATLRDGGMPQGWLKTRTRQIDRDGRWTIKQGPKARPPEGAAQRQAAAEIAVPMFGYKNHFGIDRGHGFTRPSPASNQRFVRGVRLLRQSIRQDPTGCSRCSLASVDLRDCNAKHHNANVESDRPAGLCVAAHRTGAPPQ